MSPAAQNPNSDRAKAGQSIETVYTTVESQQDRTDWLTVVSNLRHINRQLLEEIARLEEALASAKQTLHTHKEENQTHEITILQQQDELRMAHDRVGALFQQLETSHQICQRQQTLIETLSHQLEITREIVPQLEAEHDELDRQYQQQSAKLVKTERVAVELHRRLKLLQAKNGTETTAAISTADAANSQSNLTVEPHTTDDTSRSIGKTEPASATDPNAPTPAEFGIETPLSAAELSIAEIDPAPPLSPLQVPQEWMPSEPSPPAKTSLSPPPSSATTSWREAIIQERDYANANGNNLNHRHHPVADPTATTRSASETVDKESNAVEEPTVPSSANWPAPTLNHDRSNHQTVRIDLPKFPKKPEN
jgi:hypothetical protein